MLFISLIRSLLRAVSFYFHRQRRCRLLPGSPQVVEPGFGRRDFPGPVPRTAIVIRDGYTVGRGEHGQILGGLVDVAVEVATGQYRSRSGGTMRFVLRLPIAQYPAIRGVEQFACFVTTGDADCHR